MSSGKARHLDIEPEDLIFRPRDSSSDPTFLAGLVLRNPKDTCVGFKFKTNQPSRYSVKPFLGVIQPKASVEVTVRCDSKPTEQDRFLIQTLTLDDEEAKALDAPKWKQLDRNRLSEIFIDCKPVESEPKAAGEKGEAGSRLRPVGSGKDSSANASTSTKASKTSAKKSGSSIFGWPTFFLFFIAVVVALVAVTVPYEVIVDTVDTFLNTYVPAEYHKYSPTKFAKSKIAKKFN